LLSRDGSYPISPIPTLILFSQLCVGALSGHPWDYPTNILFSFLGSPVFHMSCSCLSVYAHCHTTAERNVHTTALLPLNSDAWFNHLNIWWWARIMKVLISYSLYDFLYSWAEHVHTEQKFLWNKTIYHICSPNIIDILSFFFLAERWRGHSCGTSYRIHIMLFLLGKQLTMQVLFSVSTVDENYPVSCRF
jgi:hypothetical protein